MKEEQLIAEVLYGEETADRSRYALYENGTYMVISKFAYLIGVPFHIFENEHEPPKMEWYEALEKDKNARIIRNLCMLRTAFERNYRNIYQAMRYDLKGIASMPEYIPRECIDQLSADGLSIYRANAQPIQYIIDINSHIANRINNCKNLFPIWLNWSYIRQLFIMPGGTTEKGAKGAAADYYAHRTEEERTLKSLGFFKFSQKAAARERIAQLDKTLADEQQKLQSMKAARLAKVQNILSQYPQPQPKPTEPTSRIAGASQRTLEIATDIANVLYSDPMTPVEINRALGMDYTALQIANAAKYIPDAASVRVYRVVADKNGDPELKQYTAYCRI